MSSKPYNVFISYSHKDGELFASKLLERISKYPGGAGITFWKDYDNMHYGQWTRQIEIAIDAVEFLVMIITPAALESPNCKDEWMYARKKGVCILPVNGIPDDMDFFDSFPQWLKKQHIYNLEKQWDRFINDLNTQPRSVPIPFMAPRLTTIPGYVCRKEELSKLKDLVLNGCNGNAISITTALQGSGGFGKTTLAIALCNDDDIINNFDDGILWVTLGQQAGTARDALHKLYRALSHDEASFIDIEEARQKLAEKMDKRNCLVVIDDVWKLQDLKQVTDAIGNCTVLITTRFAHLLDKQQLQAVRVDEMKTAESIALLTGKFQDNIEDRSTFENLVEQLGNWPLLLKLAGAQITKRVMEGESPERALSYVQRKYDRKGITGFDHEDAAQRDDSVKKSLDASIELLNTDEKEKLLQLGIFPEDENIPFEILGLLWMQDDFETEETLEKLHQFALLDLDFINKTCSIHDVLLHYYHQQLGTTTVSLLHNKLVISLGDFKSFRNLYCWKWYNWHLIRAGRKETVTHLLQDLEWIDAKLFATDIIELLKDYEHFSLDGDTDLIYRALKLSAHVLTVDRYQLPAQLIGRLGYFENEPVMGLVKKAKTWKKVPWLRPVKPSLTPPGNLLSILKGHTAEINCLEVHDGKIISGSSDRSIRIWEIESGRCLRILQGHTDSVSTLIVREGKIISGSNDNTIRTWDAASGRCIQTLAGHTGQIRSLFIKNNKIISGSVDCTIRTWEITSGTCLKLLQGHTGLIHTLLVQGDKIISGSYDNTIRIWDLESGQCLQILHGHTAGISSILVRENKIISGSYDKTIRTWEITTGLCIQTFRGHGGGIRALLADDRKLISGSSDGTICIWEIETGKCLQTLHGHTGGIRSLKFHNGKIISSSSDNTIRIWEKASGQCLRALQGHNGKILCLWTGDGKIISGSVDTTIRIWEMESGYCSPTQPGHTDSISSLLVHDYKIITGSVDNSICIWDMDSGHCLHTLQGHTRQVISLLAEGNKIISGSGDSTIRIWEIKSGRCLQILMGHTDSVTTLLVHQGKIISGSDDSTIRIWELETGNWIQTLEGHTDWIRSILIQDNKIISGSDDKTIRVWELESGICLHILKGHKDVITSLLLQEDKFISGSWDNTISIWEMESGHCHQTLRGHRGRILTVLIQDNKIISGSYDSTIAIWEKDSGKCIHTLQGHMGGISSLLVHEGKIISGSVDSTIRIWHLESGQLIQILKEHTAAIRSLLIMDDRLISTDTSGLLIVYDAKKFIQVSKYYSDAEYTSQLFYHNNRIVCGDQSGQLHILEITGI